MAANPTITSITPGHGPIGTIITIVGTGFGFQQLNSSVALNGVVGALAVLNWGNTSIIAGLTSIAVSGGIVVTTTNGTLSSAPFPFTVTGPTAAVALPGQVQSNQPTITYRQLGPNNDPIWPNFFSDIYAVAQAIQTRLLLFEGEWWESLTEGTPMWQSILGHGGQGNVAAISLLLQQRILGTPYVTGLTSVAATFNSSTRQFQFAASVQTQFGPVQVTSTPQVPPLTLALPS